MTAPPAASASFLLSSAAEASDSTATSGHDDTSNLPRREGRQTFHQGKSTWVYATLLVVTATVAYAASSSSPAILSMTRSLSSFSSGASLFGPVGTRTLPGALSDSAIDLARPEETFPTDSLSFSPLLLVTGAGSHGLLSSIRRDALLSILLKPLVVELGAVVLCQAIGLPLLSKLGVILRRMRVQGAMVLPHSHHLLSAARGLRTLVARRFPPAARRIVIRQVRVVTTRTGKAWKTFGHVYKQTSLSKIVNRSKKLLKVFVVHNDLHDDHDDDH